MRTMLNARGTRWRRVVAGVAAVAVPLAILATTAPAQAYKPSGSPAELMLETGPTGNLANAIQNGWWGHEGSSSAPTGTDPTVLSADYTSGQLQAAFSDPDNNLRVVFVPKSADGSTEHPNATSGQSVDQVFGAGARFADQGLFAGLNGNNNANDNVLTLSTGAEWDAWYAAGQPLQGYNSKLQLITIGPNTVSATPQGKSILNAWPAGTQLSMVFFESNGYTANGKPTVLASGGKAKTAWLNLTTRAKPGDTDGYHTDTTTSNATQTCSPTAPCYVADGSVLRTSAGYTVNSFGAIPQNTTTTVTATETSPQAAGTQVHLKATVAPTSGTDVPVGTVEFFRNSGGTSLGAPVALSGGTATLAVTLPVGTHGITAVYTPTNTNTLAFNTSTSASFPFTISGIGTTTAAAATPGADVSAPVALTATVAPAGVTGNVVFKDSGTDIGSDVITAADNIANLSYTFATPGSHTVTAFFTPNAASSDYSASQGSVTFTLAPPSGVSTDDQAIKATIPPGTITVTTPYTPDSPLNLGTVNLNPALTGYLGSAPFQHINVFDTRSGAGAWTLTAIAGAMSDGAGHFINGQNLGLTNLIPETANVLPNRNNNPGLGTITATDNGVPAVPVQAGAPGSAGLGGSQHTVLHATQGPSDAWYSGTLTLFAPTTTTTGVYTGTITFTAS